MMFPKAEKNYFIVTSILFLLSCKGNAQISIGIQTGINHSLFSSLDDKKITTQNGTYSVTNLNSVNANLDIEYRVNRKFNLTIGYGYLVTGYRENATYYGHENLSKTGSYVQAGQAYRGVYLADYTYDTRFEYYNLYLTIGYQLLDNLKLSVGINNLMRPKRENQSGPYFILSRYQSIINLYSIESAKNLESAKTSFDPNRDYKNDVALSYGLDYKVYKEFYLHISHIIGLKRILDFPSNNNLRNQVINFNCGYRFFLLNKKLKPKHL